MIDLIYLAHGREEFTEASLRTLSANTPATLLSRVVIFTDGRRTPPAEWWRPWAGVVEFNCARWGGPVAIMNAWLEMGGSEIWAKIDNDVIAPPGWLEQALSVMDGCPELQLLGIEPPSSRTPSNPERQQKPAPELQGGFVFPKSAGGRAMLDPRQWAGYAPCSAIGGIGLMRREAWRLAGARMAPFGFNGVGGFTNWQTAASSVRKGWLVPPLRLFLLDRLPVEPWRTLSMAYVAQKIQRPWTPYNLASESLWRWWVEEWARSRY